MLSERCLIQLEQRTAADQNESRLAKLGQLGLYFRADQQTGELGCDLSRGDTAKEALGTR
jgi:hypothetical protein